MGFFDDIGNVKTFEQTGNNWFHPAEYEVTVDKTLMEKSQKPGSQKLLCKVFTKVGSCSPPPGSPNAVAPYRPGDEVKVFWNVRDDRVLPNVIDFAMAVGEQLLWSKNAPPAKVREFLNDFRDSDKLPHPRTPHMEQLLAQGLAKGVTLRVSAFNKPKADGSDFTRLRWIPTLRPKDFDPRG